jgi:hypothetical protein
MNLIEEISHEYEGDYVVSKPIKKGYPIGSTISNPYCFKTTKNLCEIRLLGVYETGMKLPPTYSDSSIYKLIIKSDNISEKISLYPKNDFVYFFENLITKSPSKYRKSKSNLLSSVFKRIDFLEHLKNIEISIFTETEDNTGKKKIIINTFKKFLNLDELKSLLEIGIILTEEIKPAHNNGYK